MKFIHTLQFLISGFASAVLHASPEALTLRVVPERDLVYSGGRREVIVQIELEGRRPDQERRTPMNLALVLDRSGSMAGAKLEKARQAACVAIDQLASHDYVSLVVYDNVAEVLIPPQLIGSGPERNALKERIHRIAPGGGTAIHAGVTLGAVQLRTHFDRERVNRIVLLSDGLANVGPSSVTDLVELGRSLSREGFGVSTIGLGDDYNEDLMVGLAEASHGNYYYVRDAEKLPGIFAQELGATRTVLARSVNIRITAPEGVIVREILGHPEIECRGRSAEIALPQYFGSDKRRFLARCVIEGSASDSLEVAKVALSYNDAADGKASTQTQVARVRFTAEPRESDESAKTEVVREAAVWENRAAKERAIRLADEGKPREAAEILRSQVLINSALPAASQIPNIREENKKLEATAAEVDSRGSLSKSARKQVQFENWQDKYKKR